jgi:hypothetical protein
VSGRRGLSGRPHIRGRATRSRIPEQAVPSLPIEIGGHAKTVLLLILGESAPGLPPKNAVDFALVEIFGLELLLNIADFGARQVHRARMHSRVMAAGICLHSTGQAQSGAKSQHRHRR